MSGDLNLLAVSIGSDWARKELAGPRAPWNVNVTVSGKVVDASLTAKYGLTLKYTCLSVKVVEAELSASLTFAGSIGVDRHWNATVMDGQWKWNQAEVPVEGEVSATLAAVGTAMVMGQGVSASASSKAGIQLKSKFNPGESGKPCSLEGDIDFTGINLTVKTVDTIDGTYYQSKPIELVEGSPLIHGFKVGGES